MTCGVWIDSPQYVKIKKKKRKEKQEKAEEIGVIKILQKVWKHHLQKSTGYKKYSYYHYCHYYWSYHVCVYMYVCIYIVKCEQNTETYKHCVHTIYTSSELVSYFYFYFSSFFFFSLSAPLLPHTCHLRDILRSLQFKCIQNYCHSKLCTRERERVCVFTSFLFFHPIYLISSFF